jgi:hypothetical protein
VLDEIRVPRSPSSWSIRQFHITLPIAAHVSV